MALSKARIEGAYSYAVALVTDGFILDDAVSQNLREKRVAINRSTLSR